MLYFCARWHFTTNKALSCHNNSFIWVTIHSQIPETLCRKGNSSGRECRGLQLECLLDFSLSVPCLLSLTPSASSPVFHHYVVYNTTVPPPHCYSSLLLLRANFAASSHQGQSQSSRVHFDWHCSWVCVYTSRHENCSAVCVLLFTGRADGAEETIYICLALNFLFQSVWLRAMRDSHRCTKTSALL